MSETAFRISTDGMISLKLGDIQLTEIVPYVNGRPLRTVAVETGEDYVRYETADGSLTPSNTTNSFGKTIRWPWGTLWASP